MSDFRNTIKNIQRAVGVQADGVFGPLTGKAVLRELSADCQVISEQEDATEDWKAGLDSRTISNIETLDVKARDRFASFARKAKAVAAAMGFEYVMISGNRTFAEQDAIYKQAKDGIDNDRDGKVDEADEKVTKARAGYSNHNFGIAGDFGVFISGVYVDATLPTKAAAVHRAVAAHAPGEGLEWGGDWKGFQDLPHFEIETGLTIEQRRELFKRKGSVL